MVEKHDVEYMLNEGFLAYFQLKKDLFLDGINVVNIFHSIYIHIRGFLYFVGKVILLIWVFGRVLNSIGINSFIAFIAALYFAGKVADGKK